MTTTNGSMVTSESVGRTTLLNSEWGLQPLHVYVLWLVQDFCSFFLTFAVRRDEKLPIYSSKIRKVILFFEVQQ